VCKKDFFYQVRPECLMRPIHSPCESVVLVADLVGELASPVQVIFSLEAPLSYSLLA
jgi:hypothetical protein